ncbi:MAG: phosphosulfolactate synthase [Bacteroidota bacterium]
MNIQLPFIPQRTPKPRSSGITMMMDKGLSVSEAENLMSVASDLIDYAKLGFGTSIVSKQVKEKVKVYKASGVTPYVGGTLFEACIIRNMFDEYRRWIDELGISTVEVSDGTIFMEHDVKCDYIALLSKQYQVLSEVGAKETGIMITPKKWINMMQAELDAGAIKVIAEARESGNVGIYRPTGSSHTSLISKIITTIKADNVIWEAPLKSQQIWFIKLLGANVNLGNISPQEIIPLETLRLGMRGDTFFEFLPEHMHAHKLTNHFLSRKK